MYSTKETEIGVGQKRQSWVLSSQKYQKISFSALTLVGVADPDDISIKFTRGRIERRDQLIGSHFELILQNAESLGDRKFRDKIFFVSVEKFKIGRIDFWF